MNKNNALTKDYDEEAKLLASLGSSMQEATAYEANVIDEAERNMAPPLTGMGFPPLHTLAPSGNAHSHLQDIQNILQQTRNQLVQHPTSTKLFLKQQMLLNLLQSASSDMDFLIRPQQEFRQEMNRKNLLQNPTTGSSSKESSSEPRKKAAAKTLRPPPKQVQNDATTPQNASERLEAIKKGILKPSSTGTTTTTTKGRGRKRVSIQARKSGPRNEDDDDENEMDESQDYKQRLLQIRKDREKRREKRRRQLGPVEDEDDEEKELEFEMDEDPTTKKEDTTERPKKKQAVAVAARPSPPPPMQTVECPLCQISLKFPVGSNIDEQLSQHMSICQTARTRGQRRTTSVRSSRRRAVINYSETDNHDDNDDADEAVGGMSSRVAIKMEAHDDNDDDDDDVAVVPVESDGEEEVLVVDEDASDHESSSSIMDKGNGKPSRKRKLKMLPPLASPTAMDDWEEYDYEDRVDDWVENGIQNMKDMKERDADETPPGKEKFEGGLVIPAWINDRLFPYQRTAVRWMWELHKQQAGGIVGDEMGLGKTVQISAFLGSMAASRKLKSVLIISPATMLQHWLKELSIWAPGIRRILIHQSGEGAYGGDKRNISDAVLRRTHQWLKDSRRTRLFEAIDEDDYESRDPSSFCGTAYAFLTTYENVRRNSHVWTNHRWSYVVMDEAQKIRNPDADITLVCKRLRTPHRLALSGTPIQNDLKELWSLFDFVFPGRLGTLPTFEQEFADPIKRGGYSNASPMQVQVAYRCALILKDLINPYLLRRLKKDIKEVNRMPGKKEQVLFCRLTSHQRVLYESFLQSDLIKSVMRGSAQLLGAITMLRKICNHPDLVCPPNRSSIDTFIQKGFVDENDLDACDDDDDSIDNEETLTDRSGKLEVLAKILPLWYKQGHRVLIFCQWKKMLNIIQKFMMLKGWKFGRLDGNTNVASRQRLVDNFNADDSYFAMLCTTRTGGVGLNLTGADRIILYDPDWNPQTDAQARERAWRFGQEKEVVIFRLISAGTVEEKIYQRQIFKTALSNKVLQDARQRRLFSQKDLKDLFSLKADGGSVISGGDGLTETGELTKGDGYVDPDEDPAVEDPNDDGETLRTVLKSKGLAGVFDHGMIENNKSSKKTSVREMEVKAKRIAKEAAAALETSMSGTRAFTPTWTGSEETQGGRFGSGAASPFPVARSPSAGAGVVASTAKSSSGNLLASIRNRNTMLKSSGEQTENSTKQYTDLLKRIRDFVKHQIPTTDEILDHFESVPNYDAAIFRRLLKSIATFRNGRWRLK
mmetsp:Transcript_4359/g.10213  ORF Transcript_4359/g.10213 Transcript_4359/m.10213 type:complete len:1276 (+) Transcript_4359:56-3883(+)